MQKNLTYKQKLTIELMRNKQIGLTPTTQRDLAKKFHLSPVYVGEIINGKRDGNKAKEWKKKFLEYTKSDFK